jgi:hypothetical protein
LATTRRTARLHTRGRQRVGVGGCGKGLSNGEKNARTAATAVAARTQEHRHCTRGCKALVARQQHVAFSAVAPKAPAALYALRLRQARATRSGEKKQRTDGVCVNPNDGSVPRTTGTMSGTATSMRSCVHSLPGAGATPAMTSSPEGDTDRPSFQRLELDVSTRGSGQPSSAIAACQAAVLSGPPARSTDDPRPSPAPPATSRCAGGRRPFELGATAGVRDIARTESRGVALGPEAAHTHTHARERMTFKQCNMVRQGKTSIAGKAGRRAGMQWRQSRHALEIVLMSKT